MARIGLLDENQAVAVITGSRVVFALSGRNPRSILIAVLFTEQTQIYVALGGFRQVCLLRGKVDSRKFLEDKRSKEPTQQGIFPDITAKKLTLIRKLTLHTTYEDLDAGHILLSTDGNCCKSKKKSPNPPCPPDFFVYLPLLDLT